jgi:hypothetical protein
VTKSVSESPITLEMVAKPKVYKSLISPHSAILVGSSETCLASQFRIGNIENRASGSRIMLHRWMVYRQSCFPPNWDLAADTIQCSKTGNSIHQCNEYLQSKGNEGSR